jgi:hypothetical protein
MKMATKKATVKAIEMRGADKDGFTNVNKRIG